MTTGSPERARRPGMIGDSHSSMINFESTKRRRELVSVLSCSSPRTENGALQVDIFPPRLPPVKLVAPHSDLHLSPNEAHGNEHAKTSTTIEDLWPLPPLPLSRSSTEASRKAVLSRPRASITRLSSLDNLLRYRDEKADWKRASSILQQEILTPAGYDRIPDLEKTVGCSDIAGLNRHTAEADLGDANSGERPLGPGIDVWTSEQSKFRHFAAEFFFCSTIAMTQFLAEYLISGFAIQLSNSILKSSHTEKSQSTGIFWPALLLPLVLSATLLIFARISDMYGGYFPFMLGLVWLTVWTLIPGFYTSIIILDCARAMQGLAIAAFMPSTFAMVGSIYSEGRRKNFILGLYSGCAPLGFFVGLFVAAALPEEKAQWYWWMASALSGFTLITAFLTVPSDRTDRRRLGLSMDWIGSWSITFGLILVSYGLSAESSANKLHSQKSEFGLPIVLGPLISGLGLLAVAFWYEGWCANCPLLPFEFFKPRSVKAVSLAGLCFYATYGSWLYNSAQLFQSPAIGADPDGTGMSGISLALWYLPTAIGGVILCIVGGSLMHIVPIMVLLLISSLAWIVAPLLLALAPMPLNYWKYVFPSMLCATVGIDLTFTVSIVFVTSVQPTKYQGLAGGLCSILVNLGMSFGLAISAILHPSSGSTSSNAISPGLRATFLYGAVSAGLGLLICILFVRISRSIVSKQQADQTQLNSMSSELTLVGDREFHGSSEDA